MIRLEVRNIFVISLSFLMVLSLFTMFTEQVFAEPTTVVHADNPNVCDTLMVPENVDELGNKPPFLNDEWIVSLHSSTNTVACTTFAATNNVVVSITNTVMPPRSFSDLWYVVDDGTVITNFDGGIDNPVNPMFNRAFKIDSVGINKPLVSESIAVNGIFESGETWEFILEGYSGPTAASQFASVGVPSQTSPPLGSPVNESPSLSTGSIIAIPIENGGPNGVKVGGEFIGIDTTAVLLAGAQMTSVWLVPFIVAAIGIGIVLARKL